MSCVPEKDRNIEVACKRIERAAEAGAQIVCLQELFHSRYPCQTEDHARFSEAETIPGPLSRRLGEVASDCRVTVVGSLFERRAPGVFHNSAVIVGSDGRLSGHYRKMHIPDDPSYYEKFYFTPGDLGFLSFPTEFARLGLCVCWDQWFPEAARATALQGAEILFYPTAIGWLPEEKADFGSSQVSAWETMMRSHAIANGVYVAAVNRVGVEEGLEFWGHSFVSDPYGNVLATAGTSEETLIVDCDLDLIETARTHWPFLRDRRIDAYSDLNRRWCDD